jgi:hypothetical protein
MKPTLVGVLLLCVSSAFPRVAAAQDGGWGWLDRLSGPGPFKGPAASAGLYCGCESKPELEKGRWARCFLLSLPLPTADKSVAKSQSRDTPGIAKSAAQQTGSSDLAGDSKPMRCGDKGSTYQQILGVAGGWYSTFGHQRFDDVPDDNRSIHMVRIGGTYTFRLHPFLWAGAGLGALRLSGDGFDPFWRWELIPVRVIFGPFEKVDKWKRLLRPIRVLAEESYRPMGISGADFGNFITHFSTGGEWNPHYGVLYEYWRLTSKTEKKK